jgi:nitrogen fixation/metabolism regulation signal transduction histidine kinase
MDKIKWAIMHTCPEITPGQMDRVWFEAKLSGLIERYDEPSFDEELENLVRQVTSVTRVVEAYIKHLDRR